MPVSGMCACVNSAQFLRACCALGVWRRQNKLFEIIKAGEYDFEEADWKDISDEAKDLIRKILVRCVALVLPRLVARAPLHHMVTLARVVASLHGCG